MKQIYLMPCIFLGSVLILLACSDEKNPAQQYGNAMVQTYKNAQKFEKKIDLQQAQKSIQEFYAANGRYPADIKEIASFSGLNLDAERYDYDPSSGVLASKQ